MNLVQLRVVFGRRTATKQQWFATVPRIGDLIELVPRTSDGVIWAAPVDSVLWAWDISTPEATIRPEYTDVEQLRAAGWQVTDP